MPLCELWEANNNDGSLFLIGITRRSGASLLLMQTSSLSCLTGGPVGSGNREGDARLVSHRRSFQLYIFRRALLGFEEAG